MRWTKTSLRNSFFGWLGPDPTEVSEAVLDAIRRAMLQALELAEGGDKTVVERKLLFAKDVEELWYARPDLMNVLAAAHGESAARDQMAAITALFDAVKKQGKRRSATRRPPG